MCRYVLVSKTFFRPSKDRSVHINSYTRHTSTFTHKHTRTRAHTERCKCILHTVRNGFNVPYLVRHVILLWVVLPSEAWGGQKEEGSRTVSVALKFVGTNVTTTAVEWNKFQRFVRVRLLLFHHCRRRVQKIWDSQSGCGIGLRWVNACRVI